MGLCGFTRKAVPFVRCPRDRAGLEIVLEDDADADLIFEARLRCLACGAIFAIRGGILDLLDHQPDLASVQQAEISARDAGAPVYDQQMADRHDREIPSTLAALPPLEGARVIEYGCGTGRLTGSLLNADLVVACDFSRASLEILADKHAGARNLGLVLADATSLYTTPGAFDCAVSTQLIEHLTLPLRSRFFTNVREALRAGGVFLSTCYYYDLRTRLHRLPREGYHRNGIYYHRFSAAEILREIRPLFHIEQARLIDITIPGERRLRLRALFNGNLSRIAESIPLIRQFANLILVQATKVAVAEHHDAGNAIPDSVLSNA